MKQVFQLALKECIILEPQMIKGIIYRSQASQVADF